MRAAVAILILAAATGGAHASSFVTPAPMAQTLGPSMILLGPPPVAAAPAEELPRLAFPLGSLSAPTLAAADDVLPALAFPLGSLDAPPGEAMPRLAFPLGSLWAGPVIQVSPSVIAIGGPAVTTETVASLQVEQRSRRAPEPPTVVRGGEVGGAFPSTASAAAAPAIGAAAPARSAPSKAKVAPQPRSAGETGQGSPGSSVPAEEPPAPSPAPVPAPPIGMAPLRGPE